MSEPLTPPDSDYVGIDLGDGTMIAIKVRFAGTDREHSPHERAILKLSAALSTQADELRRLREAAETARDFIWAMCGPNLSQYKGAKESHVALTALLPAKEG